MKTNELLAYDIENNMICEFPGIVFIADMVTRNICWCNATTQKVLGYSLAEMQKMGTELFKTIMHPDDYPVWLEVLESFIKGDRRHSGLRRLKGEDDIEWHWFHCFTERYEQDKTGKLKTILCIVLEFDSLYTSVQRKIALRQILLQGKKATNKLEAFSPTERTILPYLAKGLDDQEIADILFKSVSTIETHVKHLRAKMNIHTRTKLVVFLKDMGY